ncbi:MAG: hypothetical protein KAH31_07265, partial [Candidatus Sabulitectum sp.]|nr:hypothetical protein [Candidatus Sabulitectum sp.]
DMSNDSGLFRTREQLESEGWELKGNIFEKDAENKKSKYLPLYEAKMIHHYNHRFADYRDLPKGSKSTQLPRVPIERLQDPNYEPLPRYWVVEEEIDAKLFEKNHTKQWQIAYRWIARSTDARTFISAITPKCGFGNSSPIIFVDQKIDPLLSLCLVANLSSYVFDYIARQKLGGANMTFGTMNQLPALSLETYSSFFPKLGSGKLSNWIVPRVLKLIYTSEKLRHFAIDCGHEADPHSICDEERFHIKCELDALFFCLYGIDHNDVEYIMDTFSILKRRDEVQYGEYRIKNAIGVLMKEIK